MFIGLGTAVRATEKGHKNWTKKTGQQSKPPLLGEGLGQVSEIVALGSVGGDANIMRSDVERPKLAGEPRFVDRFLAIIARGPGPVGQCPEGIDNRT